MHDGKYNNLQETFKEVAEDDDRVNEEETLITNKVIWRDKLLHSSDQDDVENQEDGHESDQYSDPSGNANDYDDDLSP